MGRSSKQRADTVRTFICIELPDSIKSRIAELQVALKSLGAQISWVKPSNIHLTLKFLGGVPAPKLVSVIETVTHVAKLISPFDIEIGGTGCFPTSRNPRVFWVGLGATPEQLQKLYDGVEGGLARLEFARESRGFSPHLTIARVREHQGARAVAEQLIIHGFTPETMRVSEVVVMQSDLKPTGSVYTPRSIIQIGLPG